MVNAKLRKPMHIPAVGEGKRGSQGYLTYLLRQANASVRLALDRALAGEGLTHAQASALTMIRAYDGISSADLARITMQTPQTINVIVNALAQRGAILKRPDPVHGRILQLQVTRKGLAINKRCKALTTPIEAALMAQIPAGGEAHLRKWLADVAVAFTQ